LSPVLLAISVSIIALAAVIGLVDGLNYWHYGVFDNNEVKSASFLHAYGALSRIQHDKFQRFIPFPKDARLKAYSVSPAARELKGQLDGPVGEKWTEIGCEYYAQMKPCSEILSGLFLWALRDAVAQAGYYRSAPATNAFYERLANEIDTACDDGRLACLPSRATLLPPFQWKYVADSLKSAKTLLRTLLSMGSDSVGTATSVGSGQQIAAFADLVGDVAPSSSRITEQIDGWAAASDSAPMLTVLPHAGREARNAISILPAPDVVKVYPALKSLRFSLESSCPVTECDLVVRVGTGQMSIPFQTLVHGGGVDRPDLKVYVDHISTDEMNMASDRRSRLQRRMASAIAVFYAQTFPILLPVAVLGLLVAILRWRHVSSAPMLALVLGCAIAVATRVVLLAYIDASSFPATRLLYYSPASPFVILFVWTGIYVGGSSLVSVRAR
jgi:hypothetical protein